MALKNHHVSLRFGGPREQFCRKVGHRSSSAPTFGGSAGPEELVLQVALLLNKTLLRQVPVDAQIAAAEVVLSGPVKGKVKR